jgi:hypothetical protein
VTLFSNWLTRTPELALIQAYEQQGSLLTAPWLMNAANTRI